MLYMIRCNPVHPLNGALPEHICQCGLHAVLWSHISILMHRLAAEPRSTAALSVSLWIDLSNHVFDGVGLAGFKSRTYTFLLAKAARKYPLYVHRTIRVDSILYQKFALWTYSPFRHEMSLLYLSWNIVLRVLTYVCRHCNIKYFLFE